MTEIVPRTWGSKSQPNGKAPNLTAPSDPSSLKPLTQGVLADTGPAPARDVWEKHDHCDHGRHYHARNDRCHQYEYGS